LSGSESAVYVYGVLSAADARSLPAPGVEQAEVRVVEDGAVAALVSDLSGGALTAAREVRAHWHVLEKAAEHTTVLPVRFGTALADDDAVRARLLGPNTERLAGLLAELAGRVQLSVKADYDEAHLMRDVVASSPHIDAMRRRIAAIPEAAGYYERIRMGEAVAAEVERRRVADAGLAVDRLSPLSVAVRAESISGPDAAFNLAFLVERGEVEAFSRAVADLAGEFGERTRLRYVGPLPPYSFSDIEIDARSEAWA